MPRESARNRMRAVWMQAEHDVPVTPAEFKEADLLGAESEVVEFLLRFFGPARRVLPVLTALAGGVRPDDGVVGPVTQTRRSALPVFSGPKALAGLARADQSHVVGLWGESWGGKGRESTFADVVGNQQEGRAEVAAEPPGELQEAEVGEGSVVPPPVPSPRPRRKLRDHEQEVFSLKEMANSDEH
eukprot:9225340-Alexandrium_andersonii.AAC.1